MAESNSVNENWHLHKIKRENAIDSLKKEITEFKLA